MKFNTEISERIWLQWYGDEDPEFEEPYDAGDVYWCVEKVNDHDVEYIRKDLFDKFGGHTAECAWHKWRTTTTGAKGKCDCGFDKYESKSGS